MWSFARFGGEEFKRPLPNPAPAPVQQRPVAMLDLPAIEEADDRAGDQDFAGHVSELKDLFSRPARLVLNQPHPAWSA